MGTPGVPMTFRLQWICWPGTLPAPSPGRNPVLFTLTLPEGERTTADPRDGGGPVIRGSFGATKPAQAAHWFRILVGSGIRPDR